MNVKITHTLELEKVPEKVKQIIQPVKEKLEGTIHHFAMLDFLLSGQSSVDDIRLSRMHLDVLRKSLAHIDGLLEEGHSMIAGVDDYNAQLAAKSEMENQLAEQEQQREQQLSQEFHGQEHVPPAGTRKVWNPATRQAEEVHDDKSL